MSDATLEITHLLLMAKLLAAQNNDSMLCYLIGMAINQNKTSQHLKEAANVFSHKAKAKRQMKHKANC